MAYCSFGTSQGVKYPHTANMKARKKRKEDAENSEYPSTLETVIFASHISLTIVAICISLLVGENNFLHRHTLYFYDSHFTNLACIWVLPDSEQTGNKLTASPLWSYIWANNSLLKVFKLQNCCFLCISPLFIIMLSITKS